jgi:signal peptidase II
MSAVAGPAEPTAGRSALGWWGAFGAIAGTVVIGDVISKAWIDARFPLASPYAPSGGPDGPTPLLGDLVRIAKGYNDGGIFGLLGSTAPLLAAASVVVIGIILIVQARQGRGDPLLTVALGLLLGGAVGNLLDRVRFGHVIDFVDMGIGGQRFYTFNVADAAISVAVVLLIVHGLAGHRLGRLTGRPDRGADSARGRA